MHSTHQNQLLSRGMDVRLLPYLSDIAYSVNPADTNPNKLILSGDVESNPGPTNYQSHRTACGGFYFTSKRLSSKYDHESANIFEEQQHFPADVSNQTSTRFDIQLNFYFRLQQMKCTRVRKYICSEFKSKVKCSKEQHAKQAHTLFLESFSISQGTETLSLRIIRIDEAGIVKKSIYTCVSNTTTDTDPDKLKREGIETNPGPTPTSTKETRKGRKRKTGFKGTPGNA